MNYTLLNKNRPLADIELSDSGYIVGINKIIDAEAFPVGVITDNNINNTVGRLNAWWHSRAIPASRDGLKFVLQTYGIETTTKLAARSLGLSLSDQYWLKPSGSSIEWQDVNFFTNEFSSDLGDAFFSRGSSKLYLNPMTPDASSNGWLKKKWVIIDGERYLAKAGSAPLLQQPYNEVAASKIMDALGIKHIEYKLIKEEGRPLSENTDRHFGNFGFIRNVETLKFIGPAPVFDNGTSLWCEALNTEIGSWQKVMPFKETHKEQYKLISSYNINYEALENCAQIVNNVLSASPYLDKDRVEKVTEKVANRSRILGNFISSELKNSLKYTAAYNFFRVNNDAVKTGKPATDFDIYSNRKKPCIKGFFCAPHEI